MTNDLTDEQMIEATRASAIAEERERCAKIAEGYDYPLAGAATGQVIGRPMSELPYDDLTDEDLIALEEYLYDEECSGIDRWADRDQVLWEMNRRGLMKRTLFTEPPHP